MLGVEHAEGCDALQEHSYSRGTVLHGTLSAADHIHTHARVAWVHCCINSAPSHKLRMPRVTCVQDAAAGTAWQPTISKLCCLLQCKPQRSSAEAVVRLQEHLLKRRTRQQKLHAAVEEACIAEVAETYYGGAGRCIVLLFCFCR